jgi:hypothetical protein
MLHGPCLGGIGLGVEGGGGLHVQEQTRNAFAAKFTGQNQAAWAPSSNDDVIFCHGRIVLVFVMKEHFGFSHALALLRVTEFNFVEKEL